MSRLVVDALEEVSVDVQHRPHRGVAEPAGDQEGMLSLLDEESCLTVPESMEVTPSRPASTKAGFQTLCRHRLGLITPLGVQ